MRLLPPSIRHSLLALLATACALCSPVALNAQPIQYPPVEFRYLTIAPEAIIAMVPPPPPENSLADLADVETMLQIQKDRTPAHVARARAFEYMDCMTVGAAVFGPKFTRENLPRTHAFLQQAFVERRDIIVRIKNLSKRPRPFNRELGIEKCLFDNHEAGFSYPSGHSSVGALMEILLGEAMPEHKARLAEIRHETMWSRVLAGVHYPTDTVSGSLFGHIVAREMLKNQLTRDAIADMRAEILAFLEKNPDAKPVQNP